MFQQPIPQGGGCPVCSPPPLQTSPQLWQPKHPRGQSCSPLRTLEISKEPWLGEQILPNYMRKPIKPLIWKERGEKPTLNCLPLCKEQAWMLHKQSFLVFIISLWDIFFPTRGLSQLVIRHLGTIPKVKRKPEIRSNWVSDYQPKNLCTGCQNKSSF